MQGHRQPLACIACHASGSRSNGDAPEQTASLRSPPVAVTFKQQEEARMVFLKESRSASDATGFVGEQEFLDFHSP